MTTRHKESFDDDERERSIADMKRQLNEMSGGTMRLGLTESMLLA
jgi:hypothetical protein